MSSVQFYHELASTRSRFGQVLGLYSCVDVKHQKLLNFDPFYFTRKQNCSAYRSSRLVPTYFCFIPSFVVETRLIDYKTCLILKYIWAVLHRTVIMAISISSKAFMEHLFDFTACYWLFCIHETFAKKVIFMKLLSKKLFNFKHQAHTSGAITAF